MDLARRIATDESKEASHCVGVGGNLDRLTHQPHASDHLGVWFDAGDHRFGDVIAGMSLEPSGFGQVP